MTEGAAGRRTPRRPTRRSARIPSGTVTFLFTDIEGSTAMWEDYPEQMQKALARHDEILKGAVEARGGYVFKMIGDACCAVFGDAREALEATLAAQRALFAEQWDQHTTIRVRMALHTGVAEERRGDYFGPPVNRVARLLSAGHGGQILLSAVTYGLVRDVLRHMEPGSELRDLGEHRLRDLRYSERIYQLVVPDLPAEFPPPRGTPTDTTTTGSSSAPSALEHTPPPFPTPPSDEVHPEQEREQGGGEEERAAAAAPAPPPAGKERYRRKRLIGSGGMAEVYLAHDEVLDRDVALKVLRHNYAYDERFVERFRREARSAASLSHPNIVAIYDQGETEDGSYYIVMEYVEGGTLKERILREGALAPEVATELALEIAKALEAAHRRGVIHRDIKPQNVLLTQEEEEEEEGEEEGEAKVADFGIARAASSSTMTKTGALLGTAHYISPEQALGQAASAQSDLYSLGVVLYEMLTAELPIDAETPMGIAMQHVSGELRPPIELNPKVGPALNAVALKLLAKDPQERYQSAAEVVKDLQRLLRGEAPMFAGPRPALQPPPGREEASADGLEGTRQGAQHDATVSPEVVPEGETAGVSRAHQRSSSSSTRPLLLVGVVCALLVLLLGSAAIAVTSLGLGSNLLGQLAGRPDDRGDNAPAGGVAKGGTTSTPSAESTPSNKIKEEIRAAAEDYYKAVEREDWAYTYQNLDSRTKAMFTEEEWRQKNQWFADKGRVIYYIMSVDLTSASHEHIAKVALRLTHEDGSSSIRNTYFVSEDGSWKHRFSQEEIDLFMPGVPFDEFVAAQQGSPPDSGAYAGEEQYQ